MPAWHDARSRRSSPASHRRLLDPVASESPPRCRLDRGSKQTRSLGPLQESCQRYRPHPHPGTEMPESHRCSHTGRRVWQEEIHGGRTSHAQLLAPEEAEEAAAVALGVTRIANVVAHQTERVWYSASKRLATT